MKPIHYILIYCLLGLSLGGYSQDKNVDMDSTTKYQVKKQQQDWEAHTDTIVNYIYPPGKYVSVRPKKISYTLMINEDFTYRCTVHSLKPDIKEWYGGTWKYDRFTGTDLELYIKNEDSPFSVYKLYKNGDTVTAKCKKNMGKASNPRSKRLLLIRAYAK